MYVPFQSAYFLKAPHFPSVKAMVLNFMWLKWLVMLNWIAGLVNTPKLDDGGPGFPPRDDGGGGGGGGGGGSSSGGFFLFAFLLFLSYLKDLEAEKESWEFGEDMTTVVRGLRFAKILKLQWVIECIILFPLENYHEACCRKCNLVMYCYLFSLLYWFVSQHQSPSNFIHELHIHAIEWKQYSRGATGGLCSIEFMWNGLSLNNKILVSIWYMYMTYLVRHQLVSIFLARVYHKTMLATLILCTIDS